MIKDSLYSFFKGLLLPFSPRFWADIVAGLREICGAVCKLLCRITRRDSDQGHRSAQLDCRGRKHMLPFIHSLMTNKKFRVFATPRICDAAENVYASAVMRPTLIA